MLIRSFYTFFSLTNPLMHIYLDCTVIISMYYIEKKETNKRIENKSTPKQTFK